MMLLMKPNQFLNENVVLHEPVKNQIFNDSTFSRIVYSNNLITTNGIHFILNIKGATLDKKFNKHHLHFNVYANRELIESMHSIERQLLFDNKRVNRNYALSDELACGRISVHDFKETVILKISGIWETEYNCGITYKFICG